MTYQECLSVVLKHEGGYVNNPLDPGGETKFGISKRAYPNIDIKNLTLEQVAQIYKFDYWDQIRGDELPEGLRLMAFDCAINQGVARASIFMQRVAGIKTDGAISNLTIAGLREQSAFFIIKSYADLRMDSYMRNPKWSVFGKGWMRRLRDVETICYGYHLD